MVASSRYQNYFPTLPADIINYGDLPYTDFICTKTLCQGGDLCDFKFVRYKTDAGDGWERSKSI